MFMSLHRSTSGADQSETGLGCMWTIDVTQYPTLAIGSTIVHIHPNTTIECDF
jgi:hypothetical protein